MNRNRALKGLATLLAAILLYYTVELYIWLYTSDQGSGWHSLSRITLAGVGRVLGFIVAAILVLLPFVLGERILRRGWRASFPMSCLLFVIEVNVLMLAVYLIDALR